MYLEMPQACLSFPLKCKCDSMIYYHFNPPVAMEVIQLFLHLAAQAPAVAAVQPLPHHAQTILTLGLIKGKVLYSGCNTAPSPKGGAYHCSWGPADILAEHTDRGGRKGREGGMDISDSK